MAFSKAPTQDTYSSQNISLVNDINWRDGGGSGKDEDYLNVFIENLRNKSLDEKRKYLLKRAGTAIIVNAGALATIRGLYFWADQSKLFIAADNDIYSVDANTGFITTILNPFGTTTGYVGFCEYLYDTNTTVVIVTDGATLIQIDSANTVTTCVDADLPTPHLPYPVFLDGYLFLVKVNTADIYNSNLNDPMSWTAGDLLSAEMEGDWVKRIAKINNYLIAFGTNSIEYFWDAGLSPGSPLQRNDTPIKINSYLGGFAQYGNEIIYIGRNAGGQPDVFMLKDFKIDNIGSNTVTRYLNSTTDGSNAWHGNVVAFQGHVFYVLRAGTTKTFYCDLDSKLWSRLGWQNTAVFNMTHAVTVQNATTIKSYFCFNTSLAAVYKFDDTLYQDDSVNFNCIIKTMPEDFGTWNRKTAHRLTFIGDDPGANSNLLVQWSDNDYQTYNTGHNINLHADIPCTRQLGQFRERSYKLTYTDNYPFRARELEIDINKGNS